MRTTARAALTLAAAGAVLVPLATPALARPDKIVVNGPTYVYDQAFKDVKTKITAQRTKDTTSVLLQASGFPAEAAGKTFGVHVHVNPCGPKGEDAGPHYMNPDGSHDLPMEQMEIWLDVTVAKDGTGHSGDTVPWRVAKKAAGSVIIHALPTDPATGGAGARNICTTVPF
ncbi:Cu-Zn family superoxide dismutase [Actinomadura pelletieri DSM 43383]|uniref:Cu-Zn family superoxide dismutase n=1 Tax=Actinomadura pelletieri DSM 43383 TaxID=1120940 RepID=A0A495QI49_9ACTN|nr:superoxide dismutase family protein [Actinomadura pelletieri]RKS71832.1 Cu-Zn family superoxide dismutase [Actinomadura pelletieri DSM 43383]